MSLFKKSNEISKEVQSPAPAAKVERVAETVMLNLTDKMLRVELVEDEACIKFGRVEQNGDNIRLISGSGVLVAEIGKRSKAYAELERKIGKGMQWLVIKPKQGDYGVYYQVKIKFENSTVVTI